jgi:hypothetical protein
MKKTLSRILVPCAGVAVAMVLGGGVAGAADASTPVWVLPGVDLGPVLSPTIGAPTQLLAPVDAALTLLAG